MEIFKQIMLMILKAIIDAMSGGLLSAQASLDKKISPTLASTDDPGPAEKTA
jgi:hypothetical protein